MRALLLTCIGCNFAAPYAHVDAIETGLDAPSDGFDGSSIDAGPACFGSANSLVRLCLLAPPTAPLVLDGTVDTATAPCAQLTEGPDACVLAGSQVTIANVSFVGSRAVVIVSTSTIVIAGHVDVAGHLGQTSPGFDESRCAIHMPASKAGGAGGSFQGRGGRGGDGDPGTATTAEPERPAAFRAGCPGQPGGRNPEMPSAPGGAIYLISPQTIDIADAGWIDASGAGGRGGQVQQGGVGGASGGFIGLDAPSITLSGAILACGGGGGEGGGSSLTGESGTSATPDMITGQGGVGASNFGGDGGNGGSQPEIFGGQGMPAQQGTGGGGGGGGGGAGYIVVTGGSSISNGTIAPPPTYR